ncbi:MAG: M48 family metalloprotease [Thermodesulfobacteriota bacterium]|nr:M48 family metalloprotease [Thermodesulfobacteriota bacterium]
MYSYARQPLLKPMVFIIAIILIAGMVLPGGISPAFGLTINEEKEMGREFLKQARARYDFVDDPYVDHFINTLGDTLVEAFPEQPFDFQFYVLKASEYNAFAAPAGYVFVNSGLIAAMNSEEELAGILGHEIAHVYCRHISERIEKSTAVSLATLAGVVAGVFLGGAGVVPGDAVAVGSLAAGQAVTLAYSRKDERQADQIGLKYLCDAGYSAEGLLAILKKMREKQWLTVQEMPTYLSTHPGTDERIAYIDTLLSTENFDQCRGNKKVAPGDFDILKTKIAAIYGNDDVALRQFNARVEESTAGQGKMLAHYGYGLILSKKNRHQEALAQFRAALDEAALNPYILKALGKEYVLTGQYEKAMQILESVPETGFYDPEKQYYLAQAAEGLGMAGKSIAILEEIIQQQPRSMPALHALGMTYGRQGNLKDAHYYLGLYHIQKRDRENALFHLNKALELTDDADRREKIDNLLEELKGKKPSGKKP